MRKSLKVLYITRNGLLEPLGQSQVFSYLRGLSAQYDITVISYEKPNDWHDASRRDALKAECIRHGIQWLPQRFVSHPKLIAPAFSMIRMAWLLWRDVKKQHINLIHARSYIPAFVAMVIGALTRVPFIFDMRALWPEELITAGRISRGSLLHRALVWAERVCLNRAGAVVSLTHAAVEYLKSEYPLATQQIVVIPTCADLERFTPGSAHRPVIGCLGTVVSGWFRLDLLAAFMAVAAKKSSELSFELTTRDDPAKIRSAMSQVPDFQSRLKITPSAPEQVHQVLQGQLASVMFFSQGLGKLGSSPTRMAEVLGCGIPVVANDGVGDVAHIIRQYRVGVLVSDASEQAMENAWDALQQLLKDPELSQRCRATAEAVFSLAAGTQAYSDLYQAVMHRTSAVETHK